MKLFLLSRKCMGLQLREVSLQLQVKTHLEKMRLLMMSLCKMLCLVLRVYTPNVIFFWKEERNQKISGIKVVLG